MNSKNCYPVIFYTLGLFLHWSERLNSYCDNFYCYCSFIDLKGWILIVITFIVVLFSTHAHYLTHIGQASLFWKCCMLSCIAHMIQKTCATCAPQNKPLSSFKILIRAKTIRILFELVSCRRVFPTRPLKGPRFEHSSKKYSMPCFFWKVGQVFIFTRCPKFASCFFCFAIFPVNGLFFTCIVLAYSVP